MPVPKQLLESVREKTCVLYAGAGFSLEAKMKGGGKLPTGRGLGYRLASELHAEGHLHDEPKEDQVFDFAALAEDYETAFGRGRLILLLHEIFGADGLEPGEAHRLAIKLFPTIITTNFEPLFEHAAYLLGRQPIVIVRDKQIPFIGALDRPTIIKIHGDLNDPERIVITNEDYRRHPVPEGLREKLLSDLSQKTVLFVGCGLVDSDLQEIYYEVLDRLGNLKPRSFVVGPFPADDAPERKQWELFRKRWEQRGMQFLDGKAGDFLKQLDGELDPEPAKPRTKKSKPGSISSEETAARPTIKSDEDLISDYRERLAERVSKVYIFGEAEARELEKVFVELNIIEEYERPPLHAVYLGLMDSEMRRRRDIFSREDRGDQTAGPGERGGKIKRAVKPDELLRGRTQAVITGAPGCGKTTLLRYLAWKTLGENKRLPVFLELKTVTEKAFKQAKHDLAELLFDRAVAGSVQLHPAERERLREAFFARLAAGEVSIFLDGLDEVSGAGFFPALCDSVNRFVRDTHRDNTLIISTRPYALQARFEGLKEMEIAPFNQQQIEEFLDHYYSGDAVIKLLLQNLRRRAELRELARVPFLLAVIVRLQRGQDEITGERLELYRQIVWQLVVQLDREKSVKRSDFNILDPEGRLKLDFLKQLAFERLLIDDVKAEGDGREAARLVFTGDVILKKAKRFIEEAKLRDVNPYLLAADVKATPLLREVGTDVYAFAHLTIQEYLAAVALSEREDCEKIFCRAYFNPTLAEMEALPMTLGLVSKPDALYTALERLPDSLTYTSLRLRARGLAYASKLSREHLTKLTDRLIEFVTGRSIEETHYTEVIARSFSAARSEHLDFIAGRVTPLLQSEDSNVRRRAASALGQIGSEQYLDALIKVLKPIYIGMGKTGAVVLRQIGSKQAVDALIKALKDENNYLHWIAASALGQIDDNAIAGGVAKALHSVNDFVRRRAVQVAGYYIGDARLLEELSRLAENDPVDEVRSAAADARERFLRRLQCFGEGAEALVMAEEIGREKALEETRAFIVHEIKNAIGPLKGFAQLLNKALTQPDLDKEEIAEYIRQISKQTDVAYEIVNQYVDYARPLSPDREPTDIDRLLAETLDEVRAECGRNNIDICHQPGQTGSASIDRKLIAQALRNVLLNAIEAIEGVGKITAAARQEGDRIIITVSDTGPGIKREHLSRIFDIGFTTKLGKHGAGLGLPLVRRIVEEGHRGRVAIANNPGEPGATITIELPADGYRRSDGK
ncbi:MAG: SIR2 family protein [Blastocatellia bacterium]|nr:SIR2 family protein [Blastocatellia bacterium]